MSTDAYAELAADLNTDTTGHIAALTSLRAEHALTVDQLAANRKELEATKHALDLANADVAALRDEIATLKVEKLRLETLVVVQAAEIKRLTDIIDPPPARVRVLDSYLVVGGGGFDWVEAMRGDTDLPPLICGTDVGAHVYFGPDSWEGMKWNAGTSMRHCASGTMDPLTGEILSHGGAPDGGEGVYVLDLLADDWNGPIAGSLALKVNSQNSYGDPYSTDPKAWKFGYGNNFEQRSVGRLTWRRANGDLVCGQFGYASAGGGGVAVLHNGVKRIIPGTEDWACRAVQRLDDAVYLVSTWKVPLGTPAARPSPGGLWIVNVDTGSLILQSTFPDTVEHLDSNADGVVVAACRNAGIWRNGASITANLPLDSEWYSVAVRPDGAIVAGCMNPKQVGGRYWSVAVLEPGATAWVNYTPPPLPDKTYIPTLNSQEDFAAVNRGNTLGNAGATVVDVAWRGNVPVCTASGILWGAPNGVMEPAPGSWIIVNKAYDRTSDGFEAVAESDFRAHWRKPGARWAKIGFAGGNEGGDVSWVGHLLHYRGVDGTRATFNADTGAISSTTAAMPAKNPEAPMTDAKRAEILQTMEVQQFGSRTGTFALDAETLILWGHGGAISRMEQA